MELLGLENNVILILSHKNHSNLNFKNKIFFSNNLITKPIKKLLLSTNMTKQSKKGFIIQINIY